MFDNIGGKIKSYAEAICWVGIIASIIEGIWVMSIFDGEDESVLIGLIIMALGSFASWIGSFFVYGFGQLVENSDAIVKQNNLQNNKPNKLFSENVVFHAEDAENHQWKCDNCGNMVSESPCPYCGHKNG